MGHASVRFRTSTESVAWRLFVRIAWLLAHGAAVAGLVLHPGSPVHYVHGSWPVAVPASLVFLLNVVSYYYVSFSDPGIIGAVDHDVPPAARPVTRVRFDPSREMISGVCRFCNVLKPLRSHHCHRCGFCVRRFDHHCDWAANCIGAANHRGFMVYLCSQLLALLVLLALDIATFVGDTDASYLAIPIVILVLLIPAILFLLALLRVHVSYMLTNATTYEALRGFQVPAIKEKQDFNPFYTEGVAVGLRHFWRGGLVAVESVPVAWRTMAHRQAAMGW